MLSSEGIKNYTFLCINDLIYIENHMFSGGFYWKKYKSSTVYDRDNAWKNVVWNVQGSY